MSGYNFHIKNFTDKKDILKSRTNRPVGCLTTWHHDPKQHANQLDDKQLGRHFRNEQWSGLYSNHTTMKTVYQRIRTSKVKQSNGSVQDYGKPAVRVKPSQLENVAKYLMAVNAGACCRG